MGNYIYALRSPKLAKVVTIKLDNGNIFTVEVGSMSYLYKPHFGWKAIEYDKWVNPVLTRLENLWNGKTIPAYVAMTSDKEKHKIKIGQSVYGFNKNHDFYYVSNDHAPFTYNDGSETWVKIGEIIQIFD